MAETERLAARYQRIFDHLRTLLEKPGDPTARMATVAALLHHKLPHYFWTGFYRVRGDQLVVGPYQGPLACQTLKKRQGICWTAVIRAQTIIVPDVRLFPEHVSCDARSRSEIAVPLSDSNGEVRAVLDVDSTALNAFSSIDAEWLERIAALI